MATPSDAGQVAEKIIRNIAAPMSLCDGGHYAISVSIGIAIYPECGIEFEHLIKAADSAMYASKLEGKNRFTYSDKYPIIQRPEERKD
jgi:diguanylate cyclase (GGDEF)-like protein